jgi:lipoyl(octanoyl) transferase
MDLIIIDLKRRGYSETLEIQRDLQKLRIDEKIGDVLLIVEHDAVLTMGTRGKDSNVLADEQILKEMGIDIAWVERGGDVTYHGPGQMVGYPIINLENFGKDIRRYISNLQDVIINVLKDKYDVIGEKQTGEQTGIWIKNEKITAIGISIKKWITMHGFAFNINTDLSHFDLIVPCGLSGTGVTSVEKLTGQKADYGQIVKLVIDEFLKVFGYTARYMRLDELMESINEG